MNHVGRKLRRFLDSPMDLERAIPNQLNVDGKPIPNAPVTMPYFNALPFDTQRMIIESQNSKRGYKPTNIRTYPQLQRSGVQIDSHRQKVCPVCYMILQRTALRRFFGGCCPKCGCRIEL